MSSVFKIQNYGEAIVDQMYIEDYTDNIPCRFYLIISQTNVLKKATEGLDGVLDPHQL